MVAVTGARSFRPWRVSSVAGPGGGYASVRGAVRECAGDGGGAAGDMEPFVDVFQVGAHGSLGYAQVPGDLGVSAPGGHQAQQLALPGSEAGNGVATPVG